MTTIGTASKARLGAKPLNQLITIDARHVQIGYNGGKGNVVHQAQRLLRGRHHAHIEIRHCRQRERESVSACVRVIHDQYGTRHRMELPFTAGIDILRRA